MDASLNKRKKTSRLYGAAYKFIEIADIISYFLFIERAMLF